MRQFKVPEVKLRDCFFTLHVASKNQNVPENLANDILWAMNVSAGNELGTREEIEKQIKVGESDPFLPNILKKKDFRNVSMIEKYLSEGLIRENGEVKDQYQLTEKMISILEEASKIQNDIYNEKFYFCPCSMY